MLFRKEESRIKKSLASWSPIFDNKGKSESTPQRAELPMISNIISVTMFFP